MPSDLNPPWDRDGCKPNPRYLSKLREHVKEWNALSRDRSMRLVRSMRRHCQGVIAENGGNILIDKFIVFIVIIFGVIAIKLIKMMFLLIDNFDIFH